MKKSPAPSRLLSILAQLGAVAALILTAWLAYSLGARGASDHSAATTASATRADSPPESADTIYTCSMHPEIRQTEPGNCPICGMELVPVESDTAVPPATHAHHHGDDDLLGYACAMNCLPPLEEPGPCPVCGMQMQPVFEDEGASAGEASPRRMTMSAEAVALARVETSRVTRATATKELRLVGQLVEDTRRRVHISANVGGRVDVLHAEFVGDRVVAGEPLAEIYSPELLAVQEELLQAVASGASSTTVDAMRRRLELAGLTPGQIDALTASGKSQERVEFLAPSGGTVTARLVEPGDYVQREQRLLTLVDYAIVWAELEAFDSDLEWLRVDRELTFSVSSFHGRRFTGVVSWIDPTTNPATRTTRVRVDVDNPDEVLKPGMYLTAHIEVTDEGESLLIPATAPLLTGIRAVVYVMNESAERPTFIGREVVLGPRVREGYVVLEGLEEGERVVTRGAFQIDAALQILARPSMMNPEGGQQMTGHEGHETAAPARDQHADHASVEADVLSSALFESVLPLYLKLQEHLAEDRAEESLAAWNDIVAASIAAGDHGLHQQWEAAKGDGSIASLRQGLEALSILVIASIKQHGNPTDQPLFVAHCPMTFDWKGSDWLQEGRDIRNPYFGDEMYRCGAVVLEVAPR